MIEVVKDSSETMNTVFPWSMPITWTYIDNFSYHSNNEYVLSPLPLPFNRTEYLSNLTRWKRILIKEFNILNATHSLLEYL